MNEYVVVYIGDGWPQILMIERDPQFGYVWTGQECDEIETFDSEELAEIIEEILECGFTNLQIAKRSQVSAIFERAELMEAISNRSGQYE